MSTRISKTDELIINLLEKKKELPFGEIVKHVEKPYNDILNQIIKLKSKGIVSKVIGNGNYILTEYVK